jgi:hypothetical protein
MSTVAPHAGSAATRRVRRRTRASRRWLVFLWSVGTIGVLACAILVPLGMMRFVDVWGEAFPTIEAMRDRLVISAAIVGLIFPPAMILLARGRSGEVGRDMAARWYSRRFRPKKTTHWPGDPMALLSMILRITVFAAIGLIVVANGALAGAGTMQLSRYLCERYPSVEMVELGLIPIIVGLLGTFGPFYFGALCSFRVRRALNLEPRLRDCP